MGLEQNPEQGPGRHRGGAWEARPEAPGRVFGQCRDVRSGVVPGPALRRACDRMLLIAVWQGVIRAVVACR